MSSVIQYGCAFLGFLLGFGIGLLAIARITTGEKMKELLADKDKKVWLGALGWFFAAIGAWVGWQLSGIALEALGY